MAQIAREYSAISKLEQGRRWSAQKLFRERVERELRHGGHMALVAGHHRAGLAFREGYTGGGAPGNRVPARMSHAADAGVAGGDQRGQEPGRGSWRPEYHEQRQHTDIDSQ